MNPQLQQELLARLDALAAKLSTTSAHLWDVLVAQSRIAAITDTFATVVGLGACVTSGVLVVKGVKYLLEDMRLDSYEHPKSDVAACKAVTYLTIAAVTAIFGVSMVSSCLHNALTELFNPQFYALHTLFEALK